MVPRVEYFTTAYQEIWKRRIKSEISSSEEWENNWGFLIPEKEPALDNNTPSSSIHPNAEGFISASDPFKTKEEYRVCSTNFDFAYPYRNLHCYHRKKST